MSLGLPLVKRAEISEEKKESKRGIVANEDAIPLDLFSPPSNIPVLSLGYYYQIKDLGSGSFGSVTLAVSLHDPRNRNQDAARRRNTMLYLHPSNRSNTGPYVAVKTMSAKLTHIRHYNKMMELNFIFSIPSHPNLIQILEVFVDDISYHLRIVMEPMAQNLAQLMFSRQSAFSTITLRSILSQVLAGLRHIHGHSFYHRDLKPDNILVSRSSLYYKGTANVPQDKRLDRYVVKLADFGLARHIGDHKNYTSYVSTRWYRSPEILLRAGYYSLPIDIWAFGCVIVETATGEPLFPGEDEADQIFKILQNLGSPSPPRSTDIDSSSSSSSLYSPLGGYWELADTLFANLGLRPRYFRGVSISDIIEDPALKKVVKSCLTWDPNQRATAEELCEMNYFKNSLHLRTTEKSVQKENEHNDRNYYWAQQRRALSALKSPDPLSLTSIQNEVNQEDSFALDGLIDGDLNQSKDDHSLEPFGSIRNLMDVPRLKLSRSEMEEYYCNDSDSFNMEELVSPTESFPLTFSGYDEYNWVDTDSNKSQTKHPLDPMETISIFEALRSEERLNCESYKSPHSM